MPVKQRVLVAEDDTGIRTLIRTRLEIAGYEALTARNGAEAIIEVQRWRPDAMVLDINMPEKDGFQVLEVMKAHNVRIPVMVLTARHAAEDVKRAVGLGAKDYLTKPFSEAQLLARVARLLRRPIPAPQALAEPAAQPPVMID